MMKKDAFNSICKAMDMMRKDINNWIINTNKKHHTRLELVNNKDIIAFVNKAKDPNTIHTALLLIGELETRIFEQQRKEYYLNKAYGKDIDEHISMQQREDN